MSDYLLSPDAKFDGTWAFLQGDEDGFLYFLRLRTDLRAVAGDPSMPKLFEIKWTYLADENDPDQMPTPEQQEELTMFENKVVDGLHGERAALLVAVMTLQSSRRWLWYCADRNHVGRCINASLRGSPSYPIRMEITSDPEWAFYTRWLDCVEANA